MKPSHAIVAAIAAMLVPTAVAGATITYTVVHARDPSDENFLLPLFDPHLGTLQSVSLNLHAWAAWIFPVQTYDKPTRLDIEIGSTLASLGRVGEVDFSVELPAVHAVFYLGPDEYSEKVVTQDGYASRTYTTDLDSFIGDEPVPMIPSFYYQPVSIHFSTNGSIESCHWCGYAGGEAIVTYHYAVPEPASWLMMLGGLAFTGGALRARRRSLSYVSAPGAVSASSVA